MNESAFMAKLLDGVEVEWQLLEQVAKIKHGKDWKGLDEGDIPIYGSGGIMGYVDTYSYNKPSVLIPRKGSITNIFYIEESFWNVDTIFYTEIDESKITPKFLYYFIKTIDMMALDTGSGRPSLTQAILNKIKIPIPCPNNLKKSLEIQAEIVRILDAFTSLTAELSAELSAELIMRKKQYNYYRDQLLSFEEGEVEWLRLGDIVRIKNGKDHKILGDGNFPVYGSGGIMRYADRYAYNKPSVLIPRKGSLGNLFYVDTPFWNVDTIFYTEINEEQILPKFLYYFLTTVGLGEMNQAGGVPSQTQAVLNELKIPVPSLTEQAHIVAILDKFDVLTNSIMDGLPREIELRQKQYEYYRDMLLSFPKSEVAA
jgi:type I restriction enzyme S subunit